MLIFLFGTARGYKPDALFAGAAALYLLLTALTIVFFEIGIRFSGKQPMRNALLGIPLCVLGTIIFAFPFFIREYFLIPLDDRIFIPMLAVPFLFGIDCVLIGSSLLFGHQRK